LKLNLAVIFGGMSVEHEISVISALQAIASLDLNRYAVTPIYLTKKNTFYVGEDIGKIEAYKDIPALLRKSQEVLPAKVGGKAAILRHPAKTFGKNLLGTFDAVFPIVHGTNAEDGTLQGFLRLLGVPFVGCDVGASAIGMDKYAMKTLCKDCGIPVLDCVCVAAARYNEDQEGLLRGIMQKFEFPMIVKPVNLGSSVGISKAKDEASLQAALDLALRFATRALVEPCVRNLREINCAVLGDISSARASVCEEPLNADEILSFENKYMRQGKGGKTGGAAGRGQKAGMASLSRKIPADITDAQREQIQSLAVRAFQAIDGNGVARIDFLMDGATGEIWLNEINTIPGSLSFYLWEPTGLPYGKLLDEMIRLAFKRHREQEDLMFSFDSNVLANASFGGTKKK
jgi:D-alanine-D-alanine ligase